MEVWARRMSLFCSTLAMGRFRSVTVDVFTSTPLAGDQLAVFTDARAWVMCLQLTPGSGWIVAISPHYMSA